MLWFKFKITFYVDELGVPEQEPYVMDIQANNVAEAWELVGMKLCTYMTCGTSAEVYSVTRLWEEE